MSPHRTNTVPDCWTRLAAGRSSTKVCGKQTRGLTSRSLTGRRGDVGWPDCLRQEANRKLKQEGGRTTQTLSTFQHENKQQQSLLASGVRSSATHHSFSTQGFTKLCSILKGKRRTSGSGRANSTSLNQKKNNNKKPTNQSVCFSQQQKN